MIRTKINWHNPGNEDGDVARIRYRASDCSSWSFGLVRFTRFWPSAYRAGFVPWRADPAKPQISVTVHLYLVRHERAVLQYGAVELLAQYPRTEQREHDMGYGDLGCASTEQ